MARILYIEDDELIGELVRDTLSAEGHAVGVINDGRSALKVIADRMPDLVILDAGLPEMDGIEVLSRMRQDIEMYPIPVLMLTGRRSKEDERIAFYTGVNDYLRKPFDPDDLALTVDRLLARRAPASDAPELRRC